MYEFKPEFKKFNPDIIVSQGYLPKNNYGKPVICEIFFIDPSSFKFVVETDDELKWQKKMVEVKDQLQKTIIIGVRENFSIALIKKGIPEIGDKVRLLPYYIQNINPLDEELVVSKHKNISTLKILFVGGQAKRKDIIALIKAFNMASELLPNKLELTIISAYSDGKFDLPKNLPIKYYPFTEHSSVLKLFQEAHLYIMPSLIEPFGISYIEGKANGCVVFARDNQPQRDMLDYGNAGVLVSPLEPYKIANSIIEMYSNKIKRIELALNGLNKFKSTYHWPIVGAKWLKAFNDSIKDYKN